MHRSNCIQDQRVGNSLKTTFQFTMNFRNSHIGTANNRINAPNKKKKSVLLVTASEVCLLLVLLQRTGAVTRRLLLCKCQIKLKYKSACFPNKKALSHMGTNKRTEQMWACKCTRAKQARWQTRPVMQPHIEIFSCMDFGQLLHAGTLISSDKSAAICYEISHHFLRAKWSNFLLFT